MIFTSDLLGGMLVVISAILLILALVTYKRYLIKAAIVSAFVFILFLIKGLLYEFNIYFQWHLNMLWVFMLVDIVIVLSLYFALSLRG